MNRSMWWAVGATAIVLAAAGAVPALWPGSPGGGAVTPTVAKPRAGAPRALTAPAPPLAPASRLLEEDAQLAWIALRGSIVGAAIGLALIFVGIARSRRGGRRRRALVMAKHGVESAHISRRTRLSQDALRMLMNPALTGRPKGANPWGRNCRSA